jgi:hypothetical protein
MQLNLDYESPIDLVEPNYPGQFPRQMPIYLKIDWASRCVYAEARNYEIDATPIDEWKGETSVYPLPNDVDATKLRSFLKPYLTMIDAIADGYTTRWDGNQYVPDFSGVNGMKEELDDAFRNLADSVETIDRLMFLEPVEYFGGSGENLDPGTVTAMTTDAEIKQIAGELVDEATREWVVFDGSVVDYLFELRNKLREEDAT